MSDTPLPLPEGLRWIKLVCRLGRLAYDGTDPDDKPDLLPTAGKVRLASSPARLRVQEPDGRWRSVSLDDREYTIRADGELVDTEGRVGVWIPDPASALLDPRPYTLVATVTPAAGERWAAKITGETLPDVVDLVAHSETAAIPASAVPGLSSRIAALEGILADGGTGTGSGVEEVSGVVALESTGPRLRQFYTLAETTIDGETFDEDTALVARRTAAGVWQVAVVDSADWRAFNFVSDTTAPTVPTGLSATAASATSVNLAWSASTDAVGVTGYEYRVDGGAAIDAGAGLTETVTGLTASTLYSFEVRAYDAAGNRSGWSAAASATTSASAGDTTPPTAGTLASSSITDTGFTLTVSGASDAVALHATPYAFSTNNGSAWTAWQVSSAYTASGLTAATGYQARHKVRDAAGNEAIGTAITVTTEATPVVPLADAVMALSPIGYWKLNETTGTVAADSSGNGRNGTYTGTHTLAARDGYATFAGGSVTIADNDVFSLAVSEELTVFACFRLDANNTALRAIASKAASSAGQFEWAICATDTVTNGLTGVVWDTAATDFQRERAAVPSAATWHATAMVATSVRGARMPLYLDSGTPLTTTQGTIASGAIANSTAPLNLAARYAGNGTLAGALAHVAIFDGALTAAQIGGLINAARGEGLAV